jgi:hypothetical protein
MNPKQQTVQSYIPINTTMTLLKPVSTPSLLTPYELYFIQFYYKEKKLIPEQNPCEPNPLTQLAIDPSHVLPS